jgi:cell wall-associated NlpC family hydrolase
MPAPVIVAATQVARKIILRRLLKLGLIALPVVLVGAMSVGLLVLLVATGGNDEDLPSSASSCMTLTTDNGVQLAGLTAEQLANAQTIVAVGRQLDVPAYGWVIAVATALQESSLTNLTSGHLDSVGLFQQRAAWGSEAQRLDPATAARMFYEGGKGGQKGLVQVSGFEAMPLTRAAQAVQASALPDAYARWEPLAQQIVSDPSVLSATCYTEAAYAGDGTPGSNAVASALQVLGTPYSWGGGGIGGAGKGFGPGSDTVGFDCSSLVQYAYHQATGKTLPRVTDAQAAALPALPPGSELKAGDLLFFRSPGDPPGSYHHVGIYDGQGGMVHAPRTGKTVEVVHDVLTNPYFASQLAHVARPESGNVHAQGGRSDG